MKFFADECFHGDILQGLLAIYPELDLVRVQDTPLSGSDDITLLEAAAEQDRILLTHDIKMLVKEAYARVRAGLPMPGVIEVAQRMPIGQAINDLVLLIGASDPEEFENQVKYVPIR